MTTTNQTQSKVLRDYLRLGLVTEPTAVRTADGYFLTFKLRGRKEAHVLTKARGGPRLFASLDRMISFLETSVGAIPALTIDLTSQPG